MYRPLLLVGMFVSIVLGQYPVNIKQLCSTISGKMGSHFVRDPRNCSRMYNCDGDLSFPVLMNCNRELHFSQSQQVCVYINSEYDDCRKNVYAGKYNDPLCRPNPKGANRDPRSCNHFIPCWKGNSYPSMKCQGNLEFSFEKQQCVEPGTARCRRPLV